MSDAQILQLLDELDECPSRVFGNRKLFVTKTRVVVMNRVGKGERWSLSPSSGVISIVRFIESICWEPREVREWVHAAMRLNFAAHAQAMGAHSL